MYLILGSQGQLGRSFVTVLNECGLPYSAPQEEEANILDQGKLRRIFQESAASIVINCAGYTDVDACVRDKEHVYEVNAQGIGNIGMVCKELGILCVHFSTDYVFSGDLSYPYTENDSPDPLSEYGKSKYQGEQMLLNSGAPCFLLRVSWLYSPYGNNNFYQKIRNLGHKQSRVNVVCDQVGTPTYAPYLAKHVLDILPQFKPELHAGIYHLGDEGVASWYDFAYMIMRVEGFDMRVLPVSSCDYESKVERPSYSVLSKEKIKKTFAVHLNHWSEGVYACHRILKEMS